MERLTKRKRTTLQDVARESGVSIATVSYVLNNQSGDVSTAVRQRVLHVIRELQYQPRAAVRGDRALSTNTIGMIFHSSGLNALIDHPYQMHLLDGILSVTGPNKVHVTLFTTDDWSDVRSSIRTYIDGRCDGLLLAGPTLDDRFFVALQERGFPFVVINGATSQGGIASVNVDNRLAADSMTTYLIEKGHRRIAFSCGTENSASAVERLAGYRFAMARAGIECDMGLILPGWFGSLSGLENTRRLLELPELRRPTALFCASDAIARGAYQALAERNLPIPEAMSVVGFDDLPVATTLSPPLTTMRQSFQTLGLRATEILLRRIESSHDHRSGLGPPPVEKLTMTAERVERGSVAAPRI